MFAVLFLKYCCEADSKWHQNAESACVPTSTTQSSHTGIAHASQLFLLVAIRMIHLHMLLESNFRLFVAIP